MSPWMHLVPPTLVPAKPWSKPGWPEPTISWNVPPRHLTGKLYIPPGQGKGPGKLATQTTCSASISGHPESQRPIFPAVLHQQLSGPGRQAGPQLFAGNMLAASLAGPRGSPPSVESPAPGPSLPQSMADPSKTSTSIPISR